MSKVIKKSINKYFGNDLEYALIRIGIDRYILVTPYLDDKNDYIELELYIDNKKRLVITDFGTAMDYLIRGETQYFLEGSLYKRVRKIADRIGVDIKGSKFQIRNNLKNAGEGVYKLLGALQRVYNLVDLIEECNHGKFSNILKQVCKSDSGIGDNGDKSPLGSFLYGNPE